MDIRNYTVDEVINLAMDFRRREGFEFGKFADITNKAIALHHDFMHAFTGIPASIAGEDAITAFEQKLKSIEYGMNLMSQERNLPKDAEEVINATFINGIPLAKIGYNAFVDLIEQGIDP